MPSFQSSLIFFPAIEEHLDLLLLGALFARHDERYKFKPSW